MALTIANLELVVHVNGVQQSFYFEDFEYFLPMDVFEHLLNTIVETPVGLQRFYFNSQTSTISGLNKRGEDINGIVRGVVQTIEPIDVRINNLENPLFFFDVLGLDVNTDPMEGPLTTSYDIRIHSCCIVSELLSLPPATDLNYPLAGLSEG